MTCPETSVLARFASDIAVHSTAQATSQSRAGEGSAGAFPSPPSGDPPVSTQPTASPEPEDLSSLTLTLTPGEQPNATEESTPLPQLSILSRTEELENIKERLGHLCGLLVRDRLPYCPANGILALIPFAATDDDSLARQAGVASHIDISSARKAPGVSCPLFALLCNIEKAESFERIFRAYASSSRQASLGRSFPLVPDTDLPERVQMIDTGMEWICQSLIAPMVYRLIELEHPTTEEKPEPVQSNMGLIRFLSSTHERWRRLGRILGRVVLLIPEAT